MERKGSNIFMMGLLVFILLISVIGTTFSYFGATNRNVKGETTVQFSKGTLIYSDPTISGGTVNPGEVVLTKTFVLDGSISYSDNLTYKVSLNIDNNTYSDDALTYTISNTSSCSSKPIEPSVTPVSIPSGESSIAVGVGSFSGPVTDCKHTYTLTITRSAEVGNQPGEFVINGNLSVTQGS